MTAIALHNLARLLKTQNDLDTAREYWARALVTFERALGAEHPTTQKARAQFAEVVRILEAGAGAPEPPRSYNLSRLTALEEQCHQFQTTLFSEPVLLQPEESPPNSYRTFATVFRYYPYTGNL